MSTIAEILANPEAHGFEWRYGPVSKNGMELSAKAPWMGHLDVTKMSETFGQDYFLDIANGTSGKVRDQGIAREMLWEDRKTSADDIKRRIVEAALGQKTRRTRVTVVEKRIYVADDGQEFEDKALYLAHQIDLKQK